MLQVSKKKEDSENRDCFFDEKLQKANLQRSEDEKAKESSCPPVRESCSASRRVSKAIMILFSSLCFDLHLTTTRQEGKLQKETGCWAAIRERLIPSESVQ